VSFLRTHLRRVAISTSTIMTLPTTVTIVMLVAEKPLASPGEGATGGAGDAATLVLTRLTETSVVSVTVTPSKSVRVSGVEAVKDVANCSTDATVADESSVSSGMIIFTATLTLPAVNVMVSVQAGCKHPNVSISLLFSSVRATDPSAYVESEPARVMPTSSTVAGTIAGGGGGGGGGEGNGASGEGGDSGGGGDTLVLRETHSSSFHK